MDSQFLHNLILISFTKVASAHLSINYFQLFWRHMRDGTFSHPSIWKFPENVSHFLFDRLFKSVNFFFETPGMGYTITLHKWGKFKFPINNKHYRYTWSCCIQRQLSWQHRFIANQYQGFHYTCSEWQVVIDVKVYATGLALLKWWDGNNVLTKYKIMVIRVSSWAAKCKDQLTFCVQSMARSLLLGDRLLSGLPLFLGGVLWSSISLRGPPGPNSFTLFIR